MDSCVVFTEIRKKEKGELNPVIVSFQDCDLTEKSITKSKVQLKPTPKADGTIVKITTPNGHEFVSDQSTSTSGMNLVVIRNKKTNKMKLVEVDCASLMNSVLMKKPEAPVISQKDVKAAVTLNKTFGGKKAQRRMDQQEKLNIDASFVESELKETVKDMNVSEIGNISTSGEEGLSTFLPPMNREAANVSDVFSLVKMIGDEELQELRNEATNALDDKNYTNGCSEFFQHCYKQIVKTNTNLEVQVAGILYAELLIGYLKIPLKNLKSKVVSICNFSDLVRNKILDDFAVRTSTTSINRPTSMKDKTVCYVIAIATICCNYQIDLLSLSKSSAFNIKKLSQLARYLGLVPAGKESTTYVLKIPLAPLPKPSKARAKKR